MADLYHSAAPCAAVARCGPSGAAQRSVAELVAAIGDCAEAMFAFRRAASAHDKLASILLLKLLPEVKKRNDK